MKKFLLSLVGLLAVISASADTQEFGNGLTIPGLATTSKGSELSTPVKWTAPGLGLEMSILQCYKSGTNPYMMAVKGKAEIKFTVTKDIKKISVTTPSSGTLAGNGTLALYTGDSAEYDCYNICNTTSTTYDFVPSVTVAGTTYTLKNINNPENAKNGNVQIAKLSIEYVDGGDGPAPVENVKVDDIAALLAANAGLDGSQKEVSSSVYELSNPVTAVYQNGQSLYVKDESGYLLVYGATGKTYENGDVIAAGICGKVQNYYNLFELVEFDAATFADGVAGPAVEPVDVKVDGIESQPVSAYVKLEGVSVAGMLESVSNFKITDPAIEGVTLQGRNNFKIGAVNGENLTVYGFVVKYNNTYQVYPVEITTAGGLDIVAMPYFSVAPGEVDGGTEVAITCATDGASIYYTLDGEEPTVNSTLYDAPIVINEDVTIKAIAVKDGMESSAVKVGAYTVKVIPANVAMFNFSKPATLDPAYPADINGEGLDDESGNKSAKVNDVHFYNGNVAVTNAKGTSTDAKIWYQSSGAIQLRVYSGGSTTIQSTDPDNNIVKIVFTYNNGKTSYDKVTAPEAGTWTASTGTWTGDAQKVVFAYTGAQQINLIEVTCAKDLTAGTPLPPVSAGVDDVVADEDGNGVVEYYNLQGVRVENPQNGLYIKRIGAKAVKVYVK